MLYLVRHAKAGSRHDWDGDDELRPLSKAGRLQAEAVGARLAQRSIATLVSSPYVRCVQTLEPLARIIGGKVRTDERLAENNHAGGALELLASLPDGSVLCSHGDVIPEAVAALERRGCAITSPAEWRKASVWLVRRDAEGSFTSAKAWPPPDT